MVIQTFIFYTLKANKKLKYKFPKIHKKLKRNDFPEVDRGKFQYLYEQKTKNKVRAYNLSLILKVLKT